jgi:hypothetical protein
MATDIGPAALIFSIGTFRRSIRPSAVPPHLFEAIVLDQRPTGSSFIAMRPLTVHAGAVVSARVTSDQTCR